MTLCAEGSPPMGLRGSQVVIVGGSSGMGLATAAAALDHGAVVTIAGRSAERLHRAQATLGEARAVVAVVADVTREADVQGCSASLTASIMSSSPPGRLP